MIDEHIEFVWDGGISTYQNYLSVYLRMVSKTTGKTEGYKRVLIEELGQGMVKAWTYMPLLSITDKGINGTVTRFVHTLNTENNV